MSRSPLKTALNSSSLLQVAFLIAFLETALRIGLGRSLHPFFYLLTPPVIAVIGFGLFGPKLRTRALGMRQRYATDVSGNILARLLIVVVVGHAVALFFGTALFFLIDTPVQALLYWVGFDARPPLFGLAWPVIGVTVGTFLSLTLITLIAVSISDGHSIRRATEIALTTDSRTLLTLCGLHLLVAACVFLGVAFGYVLALGAGSIRLFFALSGTLVVLFTTVPIALVCVTTTEHIRDRIGGTQLTNSSQTEGLPVARLAVVLLLVVSLATLAGGARMMELRPMDSPEALPDDPDGMYDTAFANTLSESHDVEWVTDPGTDDETRIAWQFDREDRQILWTTRPGEPPEYASTGGQTETRVSEVDGLLWYVLAGELEALETADIHSPSNYARWADDPTELIVAAPPEPVTGWEIIEDTNRTVTLSLSNETAGFQLVSPASDPDVIEEIERMDIQATVDTEYKTLAELRIEFEADAGGNARVSADERYRFERGGDVSRPDHLGSPSLSEYVWRALVY